MMLAQSAPDVIIIGAGLMGAAAARHLAEAGVDVALVGPSEPEESTAHQGVFAAHYDEGRITRRLATDADWSVLAQRSIARYREIEARSGIPVFAECGAMMLGPESYIRSVREVQARFAIEVEDTPGEKVRERFPFFHFPEGTAGLYEAKAAGVVNPRTMLRAQLQLASEAGAVHIPAIVHDVRLCGQRAEVATSMGVLGADKILLATGGYAGFVLGCLPALPVVSYARTIAFFEVEEKERQRLSAMPSLVFRLPGWDGEPYLLPPVRYPDGRWYLKIGGDPENLTLHSCAEVNDWFRSGGSSHVREHLTALIYSIMPGLDIRSVHMGSCMTSFTPSGLPIIDQLEKRLYVAVGGNGAAGKSADEIGRLAALRVMGQRDGAYDSGFEFTA